MEEDLKRITKYFGLKHQIGKLREEAQEFLDSDDDPSEIADVFILAVQIYLASPVVRKQVRLKINRTLSRMVSGYYLSEIGETK